MKNVQFIIQTACLNEKRTEISSALLKKNYFIT